MHVSAISELVNSIVERRGLTEAEATAIVERVLREDPVHLPGRFRVPTEMRIRIERLATELKSARARGPAPTTPKA